MTQNTISKKMKSIILCFSLLVFTAELFSEPLNTHNSNNTDNAASISAQLAMSTIDYPVTAGDIYTLAFAAGSTQVNYTVSVDSSYKFRVANLAVLNVAGLTFIQLKKQVEEIVSKNYPLSGVQLVLVTPAAFQVTVQGEVTSTREQKAWALTRLSEVVYQAMTPYSSIRNITITSISGRNTHYDLFKAKRFGDLANDPYVRPGDVITINRAGRLVEIYGEVERPGKYELLVEENLNELVYFYGGGITDFADTNRIELSRYTPSTGKKRTLYLSKKYISDNYALQNHDVVNINSTVDLRPVMTIEGAVDSTRASDLSSELSPGKIAEMDKIIVRFDPNTNYSFLIRSYEKNFLRNSDLSKAYIIRGSDIIPIDVAKILYDTNFVFTETVQPNDILRIPFRLYYVSVSGAVRNPGRYPYVPDRDYEYYIGLAGGFDESRNGGRAVTITDIDGKKMKKTDPITPETTINARANMLSYQINTHIIPWLSIISTFISTIALILSVSTR